MADETQTPTTLTDGAPTVPPAQTSAVPPTAPPTVPPTAPPAEPPGQKARKPRTPSGVETINPVKLREALGEIRAMLAFIGPLPGTGEGHRQRAMFVLGELLESE